MFVWQLYVVPGFILSGGYLSLSSRNKVELYNPSSGNSCSLQNLQEERFGHSSCGDLICGGTKIESIGRSCEKITGTEVSPLPSLTLRQLRYGHLCWTLPRPSSGRSQIMLLGGKYSPTTTEIVSGSSSTEGFTLPYRTRHKYMINNYHH